MITTLKWSEEEKKEIIKQSNKYGVGFSDFICMQINDEDIPNSIPLINKKINRERTSLRLPEVVYNKLIKTKKTIEKKQRSIFMWEIILYYSLKK